MNPLSISPQLVCVAWIAAFFTAGTPGVRADGALLYWRGGVGEWNTAASNWVTSPFGMNATRFASGDAVVAFYGSLFIGSNGVPIPVAPSSASFSGHTMVHGGDITGPATVTIADEESSVIFSNYAGSLSFTGGTLLADEGTLIIDAEALPEVATIWFGTSPIVFDEGGIRIRSASASRSVALANELSIEDGSGLDFSACAGPGSIAGLLKLFSTLNVTTGGQPGPPVTISGPVQVGDSGGDTPALWRGYGSVRDLVVQGKLSNGPEAGLGDLRPLELVNYDKGTIRFTGSNTFSQGTVIGGNPFASVDPNGLGYSVEVATNSSLGTGDVEVQANGLLRLLGAGAIHPSARLTVDGSVYVAANVTVTCRQLTLGGQTHTRGTYTVANGNGRIAGPGSIRVECGPVRPAVPPSLALQYNAEPGPASVVLSFMAAPCQSYQIETTESLRAPEWRVLTTIGAEANERPVSFTTGLGPFGGNRFFRSVSPGIR